MAIINELISKPDNVEIIREQIAGILHDEIENQFELATAQGEENADDFKIKVYLEHELPFTLKDDNDAKNFPCVNVSLDGTVQINGSTKNADKTMKATFLIDCYNHGNFSGDGLTGRSANVAVWKTARIIRNIICASDYMFLHLRGIVGGREIVKMQTGKPQIENSAANISVCRITLEVTYDEQSPIVEGVGCEPITVIVSYDGLVC